MESQCVTLWGYELFGLLAKSHSCACNTNVDRITTDIHCSSVITDLKKKEVLSLTCLYVWVWIWMRFSEKYLNLYPRVAKCTLIGIVSESGFWPTLFLLFTYWLTVTGNFRWGSDRPCKRNVWNYEFNYKKNVYILRLKPN